MVSTVCYDWPIGLFGLPRQLVSTVHQNAKLSKGSGGVGAYISSVPISVIPSRAEMVYIGQLSAA